MQRNLYTLCLVILASMPILALAQVMGEAWMGTYEPMVAIPGITPNQDTTFVSYVNALYGVAIVVAAIIAVIKLVLAGAKYMMSDVVTTKGQAIEDIKGALLGLLIIITAFLILQTINPQLTKIDVLPSERMANIAGEDLTAYLQWQGFNPPCTTGGNCQTLTCPDYVESSWGLGECATWCANLNGIHVNRSAAVPGALGGGADTCVIDSNLVPVGILVSGTSNTYQCPSDVAGAGSWSGGAINASSDQLCSAWCAALNGTFDDTWTGGGSCTYGQARPLQTSTIACTSVGGGGPGGGIYDCTGAIAQCRTLPGGSAGAANSGGLGNITCTHY